jgi:hypothetical protein
MNTPSMQQLTRQSTVSGAVGAGQPAADRENVDRGLAGAMTSRQRGGAVLACWRDDKTAAGRTTVLAHCSLWHDDESAARRMVVLASWLDDKSAAGRTMVLARWRDDESAAGRTMVLASWHNDSVLVRWRDDESVAGGPHRPQRRRR